MANTQAFCDSAKVDMMSGNIALGTCDQTRTISNKDALKAALYFTSATINASTTIYTVTGEIDDASYTTAGITVTNATEPNVAANIAYWTPSASLVWSNLTEENFNCVLIYNDQFATKYAVAVYTFGDQTVAAGDFTLTMPTNDQTTGLLRLN